MWLPFKGRNGFPKHSYLPWNTPISQNGSVGVKMPGAIPKYESFLEYFAAEVCEQWKRKFDTYGARN